MADAGIKGLKSRNDQAASDWSREAPGPEDISLARRLLNRVGNPPVSLVLGHTQEVCSSQQPVARIHIRDRQTLKRLARNPDMQFGDDYSLGNIEVEGDLLSTLRVIYQHMPHRGFGRGLERLLRLLPQARSNTLEGSRRNIHEHYDLGNDFYRLWLDPEMVYTCAYYTSDAATLEAAQLDKMHHVCRKLRLKPGERVVEAGCGWGSLARHMARYYGVHVRAYNISSEQIRFARDRAKAEGLEHVEYIEDDYRNIEGDYDVFVSVGMLEHVGSENYSQLGTVIDRVLKDDGRGLIHSVGRNRKQAMGQWIERRIFPGSYVPSLTEMIGLLEPFNFSVLDVENLRLHYARTLRDWLYNFDQVADQVERMFDAAFVRAWRLYLAGCSAAFETSWLQLFQVLFSRPTNNDLPWTRAHLYEG